MRRALLAVSLLFVTLAAPPAHGFELDLSVKTGGVVLDNASLFTYGAGFGFGAAAALLSPFARASLGLAADVLFFSGWGPAVAVSVGPYLRYALGSWTPDAGVYLLYVGGAFFRIADENGELPGDPLAVQLGLSPLRFVSKAGRWVSLLGVRYGWTFEASSSSMALSVTLGEVGLSF